jgi:hypothetical protein
VSLWLRSSWPSAYGRRARTFQILTPAHPAFRNRMSRCPLPRGHSWPELLPNVRVSGEEIHEQTEERERDGQCPGRTADLRRGDVSGPRHAECRQHPRVRPRPDPCARASAPPLTLQTGPTSTARRGPANCRAPRAPMPTGAPAQHGTSGPAVKAHRSAYSRCCSLRSPATTSAPMFPRSSKPHRRRGQVRGSHREHRGGHQSDPNHPAQRGRGNTPWTKRWPKARP